MTKTVRDDEERARNDGSDDRENRAMEDRAIAEQREFTDDDRLELFKMQLFQHVLPDLPKIPGWHLCWLTTTNPSDSIQKRMRLGYEPVKREDVPGWDYDKLSLKTGEYAGLIGINELVAFKIPMHLYQSYMTEVHHNQPNQLAEKLTMDQEEANRMAKQQKSYVESYDGLEEIKEELRKKPVFA